MMNQPIDPFFSAFIYCRGVSCGCVSLVFDDARHRAFRFCFYVGLFV